MDAALRRFDDDRLLNMYEAARSAEKADVCDAISAELKWRGIEVRPARLAPPT